jgi:hypothetical protein
MFDGTSHNTIGKSFSIQAAFATDMACAASSVLPPPVGRRRQA